MKVLPSLVSAICFLTCSLEIAQADEAKGTPKQSATPIPEWQKHLTPPKPGRFPTVRPIKATYGFGWGAITAAHGTLEFSRPSPDVGKVEMTAHTSGMVRSLWALDSQVIGYTDLDTLHPIRVREADRYHDGSNLIVQEFNAREVHKAKGAVPSEPPPGFFNDVYADDDRLHALAKAKVKTVKIPDLFDLHSAVLFVRSQPLEKGDVIRIVVFQDSAPYLATVKVLGREKVTVPAGTYPAIKLDLSLQKITDKLTLIPQKRFKKATGWLSDDDNRTLVKLEAEIFVGSVWLQLEKVTTPGK